MIQAYKEYWKNITVMDARAKRGQYWWPQVVNYFVLFLYSWLTNLPRYYDFATESIKEMNIRVIVFLVLSFLIWLANFTVRARRLHDTNKSNWWILLYIIPILGPIIMFVLLILPSSAFSRWTHNQSELY